MGFYINSNSKGEGLTAHNKVQQLINDGATITDSSFKENLVCVIENMAFDAAAYAYSEQERNEFAEDDSGRKKTWLLYEHAKKLSGYGEE